MVCSSTGQLIADSYSAIRFRIHEKAHNYFVFARLPQRQKNQFFGATDALLDTNIGEHAFSGGIKAAPASQLLICYGFLQVLYVQQDAVAILSKSLGMRWKPESDVGLKMIRDARNRLCGHPAEAGVKDGRISSAIIIPHEITEEKFTGAVYYEDSFEKITIDVRRFLDVNRERLLVQMTEIENEMDARERAFREALSTQSFAEVFENGFDYLLRRLWCSLENEDRRVQAECHAGMIETALKELQEKLAAAGFDDGVNSSSFRITLHGIGQLREIITGQDFSTEQQDQFDLIFRGVERYLSEIITEMRELDAKCRAPV
jgi:hypothetical protein